jgi:hypothetical protein
MIDNPDYSVWRTNFGMANPGAASSASLDAMAAPVSASVVTIEPETIQDSARSIAFGSLGLPRPSGSRLLTDQDNVIARLTQERIRSHEVRAHDDALLAIFAADAETPDGDATETRRAQHARADTILDAPALLLAIENPLSL